MTIADAKQLLRIPDLWRRLGLPHSPGTSCRCPWREDRKPSFSVSGDGLLWNDFSAGEGGDAVDFLQRARHLSKAEACRQFIALAGGRPERPSRAVTPCPPAKRAKPQPRVEAPSIRLTEGTPDWVAQLAALRNVSADAVQLAQTRGLLRFGFRHGMAWFVTDSTGRNIQARRLDGQPFIISDYPRKAWTLPGSQAGWPIGITEAASFPVIALCEGGPDLLAACHFIWCEDRERDVAPVAMLGASQRIHPEALPLFRGKSVRIYPHLDHAGQSAARRWSDSLTRHGATVDGFNFAGLTMATGPPVKDLNDLTSISPDDFERDRNLGSILPEASN